MTALARRLLPLIILAGLSACSTTTAPPVETAPIKTSALSPTAADPGEVVFSGPWADEFDRTYRGAQTAAGRRALADGQISEAELSELKSVYVQCLEDLGFTDVSVGQGGAMQVGAPPEIARDPDAVNALVKQCGASSTDWDAIVALQYQIQGNPDHLDTSVIIAQCLVRVGLKPAGYTAEDYQRDFDAGVFDDYYNNDKFISCASDPTHVT
ncbi:MAG: hypothetical protein LBK42_03855 [Propionibacteriaceae bacterium]|jgi:hypothetical protein|nr:hypothetical protein [Propionibacteriaceae bacterium]